MALPRKPAALWRYGVSSAKFRSATSGTCSAGSPDPKLIRRSEKSARRATVHSALLWLLVEYADFAVCTLRDCHEVVNFRRSHLESVTAVRSECISCDASADEAPARRFRCGRRPTCPQRARAGLYTVVGRRCGRTSRSSDAARCRHRRAPSRVKRRHDIYTLGAALTRFSHPSHTAFDPSPSVAQTRCSVTVTDSRRQSVCVPCGCILVFSLLLFSACGRPWWA